MPFQFDEKPNSGTMTEDPPSKTLRYVAAGEEDEANVLAYALSNTDPIVGSPVGNLFRQGVKLDREGYQLYTVTVPYGPMNKEAGSYTFRWDGSGATTRITQALLAQSVSAYKSGGGTLGSTIPDWKGAIGVHGVENEVDGADVLRPASKFTITFQHPTAWFSLAKASGISAVVGCVNSGLFLGFAAGEILFMSFTGSEGTNTGTAVEYTFAHSPNATGLVVGPITGIAKEGHDYAWVRYADFTDSSRTVKQPEFVYVERVYPRHALNSVLGFG